MHGLHRVCHQATATVSNRTQRTHRTHASCLQCVQCVCCVLQRLHSRRLLRVSHKRQQGYSPLKSREAPETRLRQTFFNNLGLHTCCTEMILHCVSVSNQLQQWTNFCTNFSPKKWGTPSPLVPRPTTSLHPRSADRYQIDMLLLKAFTVVAGLPSSTVGNRQALRLAHRYANSALHFNLVGCIATRTCESK